MTQGNGKYALEHVPAHLRHIISAESAANDGLAYPFLSLSIYLTIEATKGEAFKKWLLVGCLCKLFGFRFFAPSYQTRSFPDQVFLGTIFGGVMGKSSGAYESHSFLRVT